MADNHFTIIDAAKYLNKSTKTVRKYIKDKKLAAEVQDSPFGFRYIITLEALEALGSAKQGSNGVPEDNLPMVPPTQQPLEVYENILLGVEARLLEQFREELKASEARLLQALEEKEKKRPWWRVWG